MPGSSSEDLEAGITAAETEIKTDVTDAGSSTANEGDKAGSPPAEGEKVESLVDRIKTAADKAGGEQSPGSESEGDAKTAEPDAKPATGEAEGDPGEFTKDDLSRLHSKTRHRVQRLLSDKENLHKEIEHLKPAVESYANIIGFLKTNDLSFDDAHQAFDVLKNIRHDPAAALAQLLPVVEALQLQTGAVLPEDLEDKVRQGYVTEEDAKELARLRAKESFQQTQAEKDRDLAARRGQERMQLLTTQVQTALSGLETEWSSSDPDYSKKREEVKEAFDLALYKAKQAGKLPQTVEAAVALAKEVKTRVDSKIRMFQPKKQEVRHVSGSSTPNVQSKPKSLAEAILQKVG